MQFNVIEWIRLIKARQNNDFQLHIWDWCQADVDEPTQINLSWSMQLFASSYLTQWDSGGLFVVLIDT